MRSSYGRRSVAAAAALLLGTALAAAAPPPDAAPQRIVTLAPHLAELVCAVGACERLVGVSAYSDYPRQAARLPAISDAAAVNLEAVLGLRPELVLSWDGGTPPETVARLRGLGLRVEPVSAQRLDDVGAALERVGALTGHLREGQAAAQAYRDRLAALRTRWADAVPIRVVYQIETAPAYTVNRDSPISDAIALCGGINVFAALPQLAAPVSAEAMLAARPEAAIYGAQENAEAMHEYWRRLANAPAARLDNLYAIDAELLERPAPRLPDGIEQLCRALDLARAHRARAR
jgi:ABC-type hemin transport system substrate-binding protein